MNHSYVWIEGDVFDNKLKVIGRIEVDLEQIEGHRDP